MGGDNYFLGGGEGPGNKNPGQFEDAIANPKFSSTVLMHYLSNCAILKILFSRKNPITLLLVLIENII